VGTGWVAGSPGFDPLIEIVGRRPLEPLRHPRHQEVRFRRDPHPPRRQGDCAVRYQIPGPGPRGHLRADHAEDLGLPAAHIQIEEGDTDTAPYGLGTYASRSTPTAGAAAAVACRKIRRFVAVDDCGNIINPMIVQGQIHGGLTQGLAPALFEEIPYDEDGNNLAGSFMDYLVPTAMETPAWDTDHTVTPSPHHPLGAKGVGESATVGAPPAIANAVVDALAHLGVTHVEIPIRPDRVWRFCGRRGWRSRSRLTNCYQTHFIQCLTNDDRVPRVYSQGPGCVRISRISARRSTGNGRERAGRTEWGVSRRDE
jgi:hypothetical protein